MTFVDTLAFQLFTLSFVSILRFYSRISDYLSYAKRGFWVVYQYLKAQALLLGFMAQAFEGSNPSPCI